MNNKIIDISLPLKEDMTFWKDIKGFKIIKNRSLEKGDLVDDSKVEMNLHSGTHIDSPRHYLANGKFVHQIALEKFIGPALVVYFPKVKTIDVKNLKEIELNGIKRILFKTDNSKDWKKRKNKFKKDFVGLTPDAAVWLIEKGIELVGTDYLGVGQYEYKEKVHQILLQKDIVIIEGLNLVNADAREYQLICFPIKVINSEAAPFRAILIEK